MRVCSPSSVLPLTLGMSYKSELVVAPYVCTTIALADVVGVAPNVSISAYQ